MLIDPSSDGSRTPATDGDVLLILRPLRDDVPASIRLRRALKQLLRTYPIRRRVVRPARAGDG